MVDRTALFSALDAFRRALGRRDAGSAPLAASARYTENGQALPFDAGLWATATSAPVVHVQFADPEAGQAGFFGAITENEAPVIVAARVKLTGDRISEVEVIAVRSGHLLFDPEVMSKPSTIIRAVPAGKRASRAELLAAANAYFDGIEQNNGRMIPVLSDCVRIENGVSTVRAVERSTFEASDETPRRFNLFSMGVAEQIDIGFFQYISQIDGRRFLVVDEEQSIVFGVVMFQHPGLMRKVEVKGHGVVDLPSFAQRPSTAMIAELFQVEDGRIRAIEAVFDFFPFGMASGWAA
jgi:hypothetical protein